MIGRFFCAYIPITQLLSKKKITTNNTMEDLDILAIVHDSLLPYNPTIILQQDETGRPCNPSLVFQVNGQSFHVTIAPLPKLNNQDNQDNQTSGKTATA